MESEVAQLPLTDKLWAWIATNGKQVAWGAGVVAAVVLVAGFVIWRHNEKEANAGAALSRVLMPRMGASQRPETPDAFLKIAADYPSTQAGARALLLAAGLLFDQGDYPRAQGLFERFAREQPESPFLAEALLGTATCLDAQGQTAKALAAYKSISDRHSHEVAAPQAKFALARLYAAQGKFDLARNLLQEVQRAVGYGTLGDEAAMELRDLDIKHPELAATAAPPASPTLPLVPGK
jgi:predicted negative regulator of RcsB-dependent stress response